MAKLKWNEVTKENVLDAIRTFRNDNPEFPPPRNTFLLYEGEKLPAKHIRGLAYKEAFGIVPGKDEYAGGLETAKFFSALGFKVNYRGTLYAGPASPKHKRGRKNSGKSERTSDFIKNYSAGKSLPEEGKVSGSRIRIPAKGVIEQKNALQLILNRLFDGDVVCEKTYLWMKTPAEISGSYRRLYEALHSYRGNSDFAKKNVFLRCDFAVEHEKLIIEYDERQHFSGARKAALESYENIPLNYDRSQWIRACTSINAHDNHPQNRDEVRAYYDSVRDIEAEKHGYRLVRIMHGQMDFENPDAPEALRLMLDRTKVHKKERPSVTKPEKQGLKICLYLQTDDVRNPEQYEKAMELVKASEADILVFPEVCYTPFTSEIQMMDAGNPDNMAIINSCCLDLSKKIGKPVIVSTEDRYGRIFSIYADGKAPERRNPPIYFKHTMTGFSAFDFPEYPEKKESFFPVIGLDGYKLGMTICYDCTHAFFSRIYGLKGVDILLNSTGGDVVWDKWYKYNQARAIENHCFNFVTMGGSGTSQKNPHDYVFGFTPDGQEMEPVCLNGRDTERHNVPGGLFIFDTARASGKPVKFHQKETENKFKDFPVPAGHMEKLLAGSRKLEDDIYVMPFQDKNIVFCIADREDILKPEKFLKSLYAKCLKPFRNKRYILITRWPHLDKEFFESELSVILKVRAMENYCAVILESDLLNLCCQTSKNKKAQLVKSQNGIFQLDLNRMSGPEAVWRNKPGIKSIWRNNYEYLVRGH